MAEREKNEAKVVHTFEEGYGFSSCGNCNHELTNSDPKSEAIPKACPTCEAIFTGSITINTGGSDF